jgi:para-nitrobenzyl esterase
MGTLISNAVYAWESADVALSETMQQYYANFVATGDPNGAGLTAWSPARHGEGERWLHLDVVCAMQPERHQARYRLLDTLIGATLAR